SVRPTAASELPGMMAAHALTGILIVFFISWCTSFLLSFEIVRTSSWKSIRPYFLTLFTSNVFWAAVHFVFSIVIRSGYDIRS
ncbi:hypothetical protein, partial [Vibrio alginolyticus]|uniref:hypothetical protein n=1 Tax=Vibrio alginolyticus TaxID=663 RepID=UPI001A8E2D95